VLTARYHIASLMAVFLALGIGIFIGGTLGQKWMDQAEHGLIRVLMARYENQVALNRELEKRLDSLETVYRRWNPELQRKKVVWIRPDDERNDLLAYAFTAAGADWVEASAEAADLRGWTEAGARRPDIILISGNGVRERIYAEWEELFGDESGPGADRPVIIDVGTFDRLEDPEQIATFLDFLKRLTEGGADHGAAEHAAGRETGGRLGRESGLGHGEVSGVVADPAGAQ